MTTVVLNVKIDAELKEKLRHYAEVNNENLGTATEKLLQLAQPEMPVLHPLPRIDEISTDVDNDPRAAYFDQVHNGVYIRMAIILALLGIPDPLTGKKVLQR